MHKDIQEEMLEELLESATRFTDIPAYLQFIDEAIQGQKNGSIKNNAAKDAVSLMSIHNAKALNFHVSFTWSE